MSRATRRSMSPSPLIGLLLGLLTAQVASGAAVTSNGRVTAPSQNSTACRSIPGDARWPTPAAWSRLNATVGGRLIATVPLAHVCHDPAYSAEECARVTQQWDQADVMYGFPARRQRLRGPFALLTQGVTTQNEFAGRDHGAVVSEPVVRTLHRQVAAVRPGQLRVLLNQRQQRE